jgi:hypothetical protein
MPLSHKPDPYSNFKNDDQRRRALNWKSASETVRTVVVSVCIATIAFPARGDITPLLRQLLKTLQ